LPVGPESTLIRRFWLVQSARLGSAAQPTMIFDNVPSVAMNPDGAEQKSIAEG